VPLLGDAAPSLKQHEIERLTVRGTAYERLFDMSQEEDREYYNWVRDRIRNGQFVKDHETRKWPDDWEYPKIWLEWTQLYVQAPPQVQGIGSNGHGSHRQFTLRRPDG